MSGQFTKSSCLCSILVVYCAFFCICAKAATSYPPSDDTIVDQINPDAVENGELSVLICRTYSGWQINSLLKFDLSSIDSDAVVTSATLNLYYFGNLNGNPVGNSFEAKRVLDDWDEETATWNNRPSVAATETDSTTAPSSFDWMQWDVTEDVQAFIDGTYSNYGWQIRNSTPTANVMTYFKSKEAGEEEYHPYLEVTLQCSGQWGYHPGDLDLDCYVGLGDLAIMSQHWMLSSDPQDPNGTQGADSYIGAGFAFDGEDLDGPAQVILLYDDLNEDVIDPNDIILEYAGMPVSNGHDLFNLILNTPDVPAGSSIPVTIQRGIDIIVTAYKQGIHTGLSSAALFPCKNRECVQISTYDGKAGCACQGYYADDCFYSFPEMVIHVSPYVQSGYASLVSQCYNSADEWGNNPYNECVATASGSRARLIGK